jgi:hypothetical protein
MSTINNISLRAAGEKHLGRSEWCIPIHVSVLTSLTIFAGLYCNNTVTETVVASVCAAGIGLWLGFNAKLEIQETAFILLAQSDLFHLLEVQTLKPEQSFPKETPVTDLQPISAPQATKQPSVAATTSTKRQQPNHIAVKKSSKKTGKKII